MKHLISILSLLFISSVVYADNAPVDNKGTQDLSKNKELAWVDEQIKAIIPPRKSISNDFIDTVRQPFIFVKSKTVGSAGAASVSKTGSSARIYKKSKVKGLKLYLIMNSKAMINGKWYGVNDNVWGYKVASIDTNTVTLVKNKKSKILSVKKDNKNIQINTK